MNLEIAKNDFSVKNIVKTDSDFVTSAIKLKKGSYKAGSLLFKNGDSFCKEEELSGSLEPAGAKQFKKELFVVPGETEVSSGASVIKDDGSGFVDYEGNILISNYTTGVVKLILKSNVSEVGFETKLAPKAVLINDVELEEDGEAIALIKGTVLSAELSKNGKDLDAQDKENLQANGIFVFEN